MYNYYYDLTDYPKLYKSTYWGTFKCYEEKPDERLNKIIENRNNFIKEYDIKCHEKKLPKYMLMRCEKHINIGDHVEKYKTNDNKLIILNSPYSPSEKEHEQFLKLGYIEIKPLYNHFAKTYLYITDIVTSQKKYNVANKTAIEPIKPIIKTLVDFSYP